MKYFLTTSLLIITCLFSTISAHPLELTTPSKEKIQRNLERILTENIIPFWDETVIDQANGGYHLNHDIEGRNRGPSNKNLVTQARMLWYYARLYRSPYGTENHLDAANHGYQYLTNTMRDKEHGGYFWQVNPAGEPTVSAKHLYGQSFALYALSEYAHASGSPEAEHFADALFNSLERHAYDQQYGGYLESFKPDWSGTPPVDVHMMGASHDMKLMNTHLHLMEAFTTYYALTHNPLARERLLELVRIQSNTVVRKTLGACTDKYTRNWLPAGPEYNTVSYGHDLENIWLLMEACHTLDIANGPYNDLYKTLFDYSLKHGYDTEEGGYYNSGPFNQKADDQRKVWWVQAECLVSALRMYEHFGEEHYLENFQETLDWLNTKQIDWQNGDWFSTIEPDGSLTGGKASAWKSSYHNARAMLECLKTLEQLETVAY